MGVFYSCLLSCAGTVAVSVSAAALRRARYLGLAGLTYILGMSLSSDAVLNKIHVAHSLGQLEGMALLSEGCSQAQLNYCETGQVMYRASMALFILCLGLASFSAVFRFPLRGLWAAKALVLTGMVVALLLWAPNSAFAHWAGAARLLSLPWLLFQGLVVLDTGYGAHDAINMKAERAEAAGNSAGAAAWRAMYLGTCLLLLGASIALLARMHGPAVACAGGLGMATVAATLLWGVGATVASMLNAFGVGLLPPSVAFAYSAVLCWHYLPMAPRVDGECPYTGTAASNASSKVLLAVLFATLAICTFKPGGVMSLLGLEAPPEPPLNSPAVAPGAGPAVNLGGSGGLAGGGGGEGLYGSTVAGVAVVEGGGEAAEVAYVQDAASCTVVAISGLAMAMLTTEWAQPDGTPQAGQGGMAFWAVLLGQLGTTILHMLALRNSYIEESGGLRGGTYATF